MTRLRCSACSDWTDDHSDKGCGSVQPRALADLLIAATAAANDLDLYTRDPADLVGLDEIVRVIEVTS